MNGITGLQSWNVDWHVVQHIGIGDLLSYTLSVHWSQQHPLFFLSDPLEYKEIVFNSCRCPPGFVLHAPVVDASSCAQVKSTRDLIKHHVAASKSMAVTSNDCFLQYLSCAGVGNQSYFHIPNPKLYLNHSCQMTITPRVMWP